MVAFIWLGVAFLLFAALLTLDAARLLARGGAAAADWLRGAPDLPDDPARRLLVARAVAGGALLVAGGAAAASIRSATGPAEIEEVPVRLARLPPALSGYTIAQVSDLHVGPTIREREVRRMVDQVNALKADAVVITGDLVDGSVADLGPIVAELGRLQARQGLYFVTGNHEYYSGAAEWCGLPLRARGQGAAERAGGAGRRPAPAAPPSTSAASRTGAPARAHPAAPPTSPGRSPGATPSAAWSSWPTSRATSGRPSARASSSSSPATPTAARSSPGAWRCGPPSPT